MTRVIDRSKRWARRIGVLVFTACVAVIGSATAVVAQPYPGGTPPPTVGGQKFFPGTARTGVDVLWLILIALLALILGVALRRYARRADPSES